MFSSLISMPLHDFLWGYIKCTFINLWALHRGLIRDKLNCAPNIQEKEIQPDTWQQWAKRNLRGRSTCLQMMEDIWHMFYLKKWVLCRLCSKMTICCNCVPRYNYVIIYWMLILFFKSSGTSSWPTLNNFDLSRGL